MNHLGIVKQNKNFTLGAVATFFFPALAGSAFFFAGAGGVGGGGMTSSSGGNERCGEGDRLDFDREAVGREVGPSSRRLKSSSSTSIEEGSGLCGGDWGAGEGSADSREEDA
jgi:hypothetical protein